MAIEISDVEPKYPDSDVDTAEIVEGKFDEVKEYADSAFETAENAILVLSELFPLKKQDIDIDYEYFYGWPTRSIEGMPDEPGYSFTKPTVPSCGDLIDIEIPSISVDYEPPDDPAATFVFNEPAYQSQLLDDLKAALLDYVQNGGTGLSATVEAAIWARARARQDLQNEKVYDEALNFFAARGFALPPGALGGRLTEALAEQTRANAQINYEISIEQARLAQTNTHFTITSSIQLEGQEREYYDRIANRAFNKAKTVVDVILAAFKAKMEGYINRLAGKRIEAEIAKTRGELQALKNKNTVDIFLAKVSAYEAEVKAEIGIIESIGRIYGYKIAGFEAKANVAIAQLNADIEVFKAHVSQSINQTKLSLSEAELILKEYISRKELQEKGLEATASISSQLAASAMSAVNASASLGYSRSEAISAYTSVSESASASESTSIEG